MLFADGEGNAQISLAAVGNVLFQDGNSAQANHQGFSLISEPAIKLTSYNLFSDRAAKTERPSFVRNAKNKPSAIQVRSRRPADKGLSPVSLRDLQKDIGAVV